MRHQAQCVPYESLSASPCRVNGRRLETRPLILVPKGAGFTPLGSKALEIRAFGPPLASRPRVNPRPAPHLRQPPDHRHPLDVAQVSRILGHARTSIDARHLHTSLRGGTARCRMSERNSRRATSPTCSPSQPGHVRAQTTTFAHTRRRDTAPPEHTPDAASRRAASPIFAASNRLGGYELAYRLLGGGRGGGAEQPVGAATRAFARRATLVAHVGEVTRS